MYLRAAELGWSKEEFELSSFARFLWEWSGYYRRVERSSYAAAREVVAIVHNVNVGRGKQKRATKLLPLTIDNLNEFTYEKAKAQFDKIKELGWLN